MSRLHDLSKLYGLLEELHERIGGYRYLRGCDSRAGWPERGVYFFFELNEKRENGKDLRMVRVGTHAVSRGSRATFWHRLSQHKGTTEGMYPGGGNHRGSIFRLHVGTALLNTRTYPAKIRQTWGEDDSVNRQIRSIEHPLERDVSAFIGSMPFLWLAVPGPPGPNSDRSWIEMNAVAILSNWGKNAIDPPSKRWLGLNADHPAIQKSGLWNVNYVDKAYDPSFLEILTRHVRNMET